MSAINWLHLSDMHINARETFDQSHIHEQFLNDLEIQIEKNKIKLDFIFFTGDIAYSASPEDYDMAINFFNNLCSRIDFDKKNLFIVPGNHDVNRFQVIKMLDDKRKTLETREEIREIIESKNLFNRYLLRFDNYSKFISELYDIDFKMNSENYFFSKTRTINENQLGIIGLNSSWASYGGRNDCNNIYVSERQINDAINNVRNTDLKIALMHHPPSWLFEEDRTDIESLLYQNCQIILHGHLHKPDFQIASSFQGDLITIPAGAIYTGRRVSNSYNYVSVDLDSREIKITPRRYFDGARKFLTDIESLGSDDTNSYVMNIPNSISDKLK